jgi:CheY-like chemotaxis protein
VLFFRYTRWRGDAGWIPARRLRNIGDLQRITLARRRAGPSRVPGDIWTGERTITKRILVVDDDLLVCSAIRSWLEERGYSVFVADGGEAGLNALDGSTFDLMIVDIFMPHMRGFESVRVFHQRAPTVPLIAISGYVFAEQRTPAPDFLSMALELGATRCLRKPFTPNTLLTVIDMCLQETEAQKVKIVGG